MWCPSFPHKKSQYFERGTFTMIQYVYTQVAWSEVRPHASSYRYLLQLTLTSWHFPFRNQTPASSTLAWCYTLCQKAPHMIRYYHWNQDSQVFRPTLGLLTPPTHNAEVITKFPIISAQLGACLTEMTKYSIRVYWHLTSFSYRVGQRGL